MNNSKRIVILFNPINIRGIGDCALPEGLLMTAVNIYEKFRVAIVDQRVDRDWKSVLLAHLKENPVCIGISSMTGRQIMGGLLASAIARDHGCIVVWGGIHPSLMPEQTIANPLIDYVVEGEGEETFAKLVEALASGRSCAGIEGVWSKEGGKVAFGGERAFIDLNKLPPTPYHLIDLQKYINLRRYKDSIIMFTSRGCPQRCTFCYNQIFNRSCWRAFSSGRVLDDIVRLRKEYPDIKRFEFWDDNFFVDLKRGREIAEGLKRLDPPVTWIILGAHVHDILRMDDGYLALLRDSGLKKMIMGVESGSQKILDYIHKNFTIEELLRVNLRLKNYGIEPTYSFMSGIPEETDEDIRKTIAIMTRLKKDNPGVSLGTIKPFLCYPGTALYEKAVELGFKMPKRLEDWSGFVWTDYLNLDMPWVSKKRKRFLTWLYYYTLFNNPDYLFINSRAFRIVISMLQQTARWRIKRLFFRFPVEAWLMHQFQRRVI